MKTQNKKQRREANRDGKAIENAQFVRTRTGMGCGCNANKYCTNSAINNSNGNSSNNGNKCFLRNAL